MECLSVISGTTAAALQAGTPQVGTLSIPCYHTSIIRCRYSVAWFVTTLLKL